MAHSHTAESFVSVCVLTSKNRLTSSDMPSTLSVLKVRLTLVNTTRLLCTFQERAAYIARVGTCVSGRDATKYRFRHLYEKLSLAQPSSIVLDSAFATARTCS